MDGIYTMLAVTFSLLAGVIGLVSFNAFIVKRNTASLLTKYSFDLTDVSDKGNATGNVLVGPYIQELEIEERSLFKEKIGRRFLKKNLLSILCRVYDKEKGDSWLWTSYITDCNYDALPNCLQVSLCKALIDRDIKSKQFTVDRVNVINRENIHERSCATMLDVA